MADRKKDKKTDRQKGRKTARQKDRKTNDVLTTVER